MPDNDFEFDQFMVEPTYTTPIDYRYEQVEEYKVKFEPILNRPLPDWPVGRETNYSIKTMVIYARELILLCCFDIKLPIPKIQKLLEVLPEDVKVYRVTTEFVKFLYSVGISAEQLEYAIHCIPSFSLSMANFRSEVEIMLHSSARVLDEIRNKILACQHKLAILKASLQYSEKRISEEYDETIRMRCLEALNKLDTKHEYFIDYLRNLETQYGCAYPDTREETALKLLELRNSYSEKMNALEEEIKDLHKQSRKINKEINDKRRQYLNDMLLREVVKTNMGD